jgi:hypothetical protein
MPGITKDQALQIAETLRKIADTVRDYRVAHLSDLGDEQEADLRRAEMSLRKASDEVDNAGINLALDDAQESLAGLGKVTQLLKADVSKLANVTKSLQIVAALVQIGTAFAEGNPEGILSAIGSAVTTLSAPAKATAQSGAAPGGKSGGNAPGES